MKPPGTKDSIFLVSRNALQETTHRLRDFWSIKYGSNCMKEGLGYGRKRNASLSMVDQVRRSAMFHELPKVLDPTNVGTHTISGRPLVNSSTTTIVLVHLSVVNRQCEVRSYVGVRKCESRIQRRQN